MYQGRVRVVVRALAERPTAQHHARGTSDERSQQTQSGDGAPAKTLPTHRRRPSRLPCHLVTWPGIAHAACDPTVSPAVPCPDIATVPPASASLAIADGRHGDTHLVLRVAMRRDDLVDVATPCQIAHLARSGDGGRRARGCKYQRNSSVGDILGSQCQSSRAVRHSRCVCSVRAMSPRQRDRITRHGT